jgi:hypothetical protein
MSRFDEGHGCPCLNRRQLKRSFGKHHAQLVLGGHELASGFVVDAASQPGDDGFAVLASIDAALKPVKLCERIRKTLRELGSLLSNCRLISRAPPAAFLSVI